MADVDDRKTGGSVASIDESIVSMIIRAISGIWSV
jgi:hypothetical protein